MPNLDPALIRLLEQLPLDRKLIAAAIAKAYAMRGELAKPPHTGLIYRMYRELCEANSMEPLSMRTVRRAIKAFSSCGLISAKITRLKGGGTAYTVLDMSIEPSALLRKLEEEGVKLHAAATHQAAEEDAGQQSCWEGKP